VDYNAVLAYYGRMIGFLIKKAFFDYWDNMFRMILVNMGFIASLAIPIFLPGLIPVPVLSLIVFAAGIIWCFIYLAAVALSVKAVSDYGIFGFSDFLANLKEGWKTGLALGITGFLLYVIAANSIPFYLQLKSLFGLFFAAVIFWTVIAAILSLQFFLPVRARLDKKLVKVFKKSIFIFFDNPGFAIYSLLHIIMPLILLPAILALLLPGPAVENFIKVFISLAIIAIFLQGPAGVLLFLDEALRLRLLKYDWLEANPDETGSKKKRKIPWDAILIDEREKTGTRSFRSFIFPWKD